MTESVHALPKPASQKSAIKAEILEECRLILEYNPCLSLRRTALAIGISVDRGHAIATSILNLYPFRIQLVDELKQPDFG